MKSNSKHLIESQRDQIEIMLNEGSRLNQIADALGRDPRGIKHEIVKHRRIHNHGNKKNRCGLQVTCKQTRLCDVCNSGLCKYCTYATCSSLCKQFSPHPHCKTTLRFPYVCHNCNNIKTCILPKWFYKAHYAQEEYKDNVSSWKTGVTFSETEMKAMDEVITKGVHQGQSIDVIIQTRQLPVSVNTVYRWIELGLLSVKNIDLKRKVRYRVRKTNKPKVKPRVYDHLKGRTFQDFQDYFFEHPSANIWQMDTVEGVKGEAAVLTLLHTKSNLQLYFKLSSISTYEVIRILDGIRTYLSNQVFQSTFTCLLTDNGKEFKDPLGIISDSETGEILIDMFYCEARRSDQKGKCEKNHEHFREFIPKGIDLTPYTNMDINKISNQINNYPRGSLSYQSPLEVFNDLGMHKKTFELNRLKMLPASQVTLKRFIK